MAKRGPKQRVVHFSASEETTRLGNPQWYRVVLSCGHVRHEYHSKRLAVQLVVWENAGEDKLELRRCCRRCKLNMPPDYDLITVGDLGSLDPEVSKDVMDYFTNPKRKET